VNSVIIFLFLLIFVIVLPEQEIKIYAYLDTTELKADSLKLITLNLTELWLESFIDTSEDILALKDYKILNIGHPSLYVDSIQKVSWDSSLMTLTKLMNGESMVLDIEYSVKPKNKSFVWRAGNGRWNNDTGWVTNKSSFLWIRKIEDKIVLYKMGTGLQNYLAANNVL